MPLRVSLAVSCLLILSASTAFSKPRSTQADTVFDTCAWVAEVQVLSVDPSPGKGWPPTIQVRTSRDKQKVFFGQRPGVKLKVHPPELSHDGAIADLETLVGKKERVLMVVNQDKRIEFVGKPSGKKKDSYLLRTWYDFNAWWIFSTDENFGTVVKSDSIPMQTLRVSAAEIRKRLAKR